MVGTPPEGYIFDLDGTLYNGDVAVDGAASAVAGLRREGARIRFLTNTTSRGRASLFEKLERLGFEARPEEVYASPTAAAEFLRDGRHSAHLMVRPAAVPDFDEVRIDDESPDYVVLGDLGEEWTFLRLNHAFRLLQERGAELIGLVRSRFWLAPDGLRLDAGPFVAALEYATGKRATIFGKPEPAIFRTVLAGMELAPEQVVMVGDDTITDVAAAKAVGMRTVLVRTGKYRDGDPDSSEMHVTDSVRPDRILDTVADLL